MEYTKASTKISKQAADIDNGSTRSMDMPIIRKIRIINGIIQYTKPETNIFKPSINISHHHRMQGVHQHLPENIL